MSKNTNTETTTTTTEEYKSHNIIRTTYSSGEDVINKVTLVVPNPLRWISSEPEYLETNIRTEPEYEGLTVIEQQNLDRKAAKAENTKTLTRALDHIEFTSRNINKRIDRLNWLLTWSFVALAVASALSLINLFI